MPYAKWIVSVTTMITNETQQFQNLLNCLEKFHFYWKQKHKLRSIPYFNLFVSCSQDSDSSLDWTNAFC